VPNVTGTAAPAHHALPAVKKLACTKQDPLPDDPWFPDSSATGLGTS
jgi:hypothetical protein